jgi:hypothetical protein
MISKFINITQRCYNSDIHEATIGRAGYNRPNFGEPLPPKVRMIQCAGERNQSRRWSHVVSQAESEVMSVHA